VRSRSPAPPGTWSCPRYSLEGSDTDPSGVDLWDRRRGQVVDTIETPPGYSSVSPTDTHVAVSPYGQGVDDAKAELWGIGAGRRVATPPGGVGTSPTARWPSRAPMTASSGSGTSSGGTERMALHGHIGAISDVSISPGGA
jgi:hypothetical protein